MNIANRDPKTGKPGKPKPGKRRKSKAARDLMELAYKALRSDLEAGKQGKRTFAECCREYGLSPCNVTSRMNREDWKTPQRLAKRVEDLRKEVLRCEGKLYREKGLTDTDLAALEVIESEGLTVEHCEGPEPVEPLKMQGTEAGTRGEGNQERGMSKMHNLLSFNLGDEGKKVSGLQSAGKQSVPRGNFAGPDPITPPVTRSKPVSSDLSESAMLEHDTQLAKIARDAIKEFHLSKRKIQITRVGDLKVLDDLYRRATGQAGGEKPRQGLIQINLMAQIGQEAMARTTTTISEVVDPE